MTIRNPNALIGDYLGTVPAMQAIAKKYAAMNLPCKFIIQDSVSELHNMAGLERADSDYADMSFDLHAAFALADKKGLHMTQANFPFIGLEVPEGAVRPEFVTKGSVGGEPCIEKFDYLISPFSRSLPVNQLWQEEKWQQLVNSMPNKTFGLLGTYPSDDPVFVYGSNVKPFFDETLLHVAIAMKKAKHGLISVVTGTSHLAYALGVKNYLFCNQGAWGKNPDAVLLDKFIPDITVEEVIKVLNAS